MHNALYAVRAGRKVRRGGVRVDSPCGSGRR
jgi:hypothetical protein